MTSSARHLKAWGFQLGQDFVAYIRSKMQSPGLVILLVTKDYLGSDFCKQEAGAAWALSLPVWPFLVPPVHQADLTTVLAGKQAGRIDKSTDLNDLRDDLIEKLQLKPLRTARWQTKLEGFLSTLRPAESQRAEPHDPPVLPAGHESEPILAERRRIQSLEETLQQAYQQQFRFLLIGQTGVGESSTVNSLFDKK